MIYLYISIYGTLLIYQMIYLLDVDVKDPEA